MVTLTLLGLLFGGCSLVGDGRPQPDEYFSGADLELARAIRAGDERRIVELIGAGADVEAVGEQDMTMLQWAVRVDSLTGVTALLDAGADADRIGYRGEAALHMAVSRAAMASALVTAGADPDIQNPHTGSAPLTSVCIAGNLETFEVLVAAGADVGLINRLGELALHTCARTNQGALILRMLELGADPTVANSRGTTFQDYYFGYRRSVLNERAIDERVRIVAWLEDHGYDLVPAAAEYR